MPSQLRLTQLPHSLPRPLSQTVILLAMKPSTSRLLGALRSTVARPSSQLFTRVAASYSSLSSQSAFSLSRTSLTSSSSSSSSAPTLSSSSPSTSGSLLSFSSPLLPSNSPSPFYLQSVRHATKKAGGSVKNSPGSAGKHLGLKASGGSHVEVGHILVRQRGQRTHPGRHVLSGRDDTLMAARSGTVHFTYVLRPYRTKNKWRQYINVVDTAAGETKEDVDEETRQLAEKYVEVLHMKRAGKRVPTVKSVYLKGVAAEKRQVEKREREALIARVTAAQQAGGDSAQVQVEERQQ